LAIVFLMPMVSYAAPSQKLMQVAFFNKPHAAVLTSIATRVWDNAARIIGKKYVLVKANSKTQALEWLRQGKVALVAGPMHMHKKDNDIDYINSYIHNSIGIVIPERGNVGFIKTMEGYFEALFGMTVAAIFLIIIIFGILIWMVERRKNHVMYSSSPVKGISTSIWNCLVTFSTVGYGDIVPKTPLGRILTGMWIIISLFLVSVFVASITSELTYMKTKFDNLGSLSDLYDKKVAVIKGEPGSVVMAKRYHTYIVKFDNLRDMVNAVETKKVTAGFANLFLLKEYLTGHLDDKITLTPYELNLGDYAFALQMNNPIQPELTRALYTLSEVGRVRSIIEDYVGPLRAEKKG
jgi:hypothetical protein